MKNFASLASDRLDIWIGAVERKTQAGRGGGKRIELYGINRLRALIIDLAVRGKLVPQNDSDEPASELLKRITAERKLLIQQKRISSPKKMRSVLASEVVTPRGWAAARFGDVFSLEYGDNLPERLRSETGEYNVFGSNGIVGTHNTYNVQSPCLVVGRKGSAGAVNRSYKPCWVTDVSYYCVPPTGVDLEYQYVLFRALRLDELGKGIKPGLNRNEANVVPIALPPLSEQRRVVAKVRELIAVCDALERESAAELAAHQALVEVLLATLTNSAEPADLAANWTRLEAHFDTLFTTEASIDALKHAILQLAVGGKLVAQNQAEEPASEILARLGKKSQQNHPAANTAIGDIPQSWAAVELGQIIGPMDSGWSPACHEFPARTEEIWGVLKTTAVQYLKYVPEQNKELPKDLAPRPDAETLRGDLLITRAGPTNRVGVCCFVAETRPRLMISDKIIRFRPASGDISGEFVALALSVGFAAKQIEKAKSGMAASQVNISQAKLRTVVLGLAPAGEQKSIVFKVDELMVVCDRLKARVNDASVTQKYLADAIGEEAAA